MVPYQPCHAYKNSKIDAKFRKPELESIRIGVRREKQNGSARGKNLVELRG